MRQNCQYWAERVYLAEALELVEEEPQLALSSEINPASEIQKLRRHKLARRRLKLEHMNFDTEIIAFWIMNKFDEDYNAALCTSSGNLLRPSHPIFFHPDQFFYFDLSFPLREMAELRTIYFEYDAGRMTGKDLWERYSCIDGMTGEVRLKNQTKRHLIHNFGFDKKLGHKDSVFDEYVKPFLGNYVVFNPDLFPDNLFELFLSIGLENKHWTKSVDSVHAREPRKRGPKPAPAKREFEKRYPDGLPIGLSADAVAAELTEAGYPITGRSVQNYHNSRSNSN